MKNNISEISTLRLNSGIAHETSEEFTLPDYMPEVRRIVSCSVNVLPDSKYIDGDSVTLSGVVCYTVLYIGDDGKLTAAPLSSEYSVKIPCSNDLLYGLGEDSILVNTLMNSSTHRATGPRRLLLSTRMYSKIFSVYNVKNEEKIIVTSEGKENSSTTADELMLERKNSSVCSSVMKTNSSTGSISGSFRCESGTKVISCSACGGITDVRTASGSVNVRGDAYINCLTVNSDGVYETVRTKSPFEEAVPMGNVSFRESEDQCASATVRCASITVSEGNEGEFSWDMEYDIDIIRTENKKAEVTDDIYSTKYETETKIGALPSLICLKNGNSRLSISSSKQVTGGEDKHVSHVSGKVIIDKAECTSDGSLKLFGNCSICVIAVGGGDVSMEELTIPVKFETVCEKSDGEKSVMCESCVMYADARFDGNKLTVDAELCLTIFAYASCKTSHVDTCTIDKDKEVGIRGSCVKIYLPEPDEDMWDIGKKYHCQVRQITRIGTGGTVIIGD